MISTPELGCTDPHQVALFNSLGLAIEDVVAAERVYRATLKERGLDDR